MAKSQKTSRGYSTRSVETREEKERFLIVCEGEKTEPNYFRSFRVPKVVLDVEGTGFSTTSVVEEAMRLREEGEYDQTWCVFDKDSFEPQDFNQAIKIAKKENIGIAYSNESFELWYLLHFHYYDTGITRKQYIKKLSKLLKAPYVKNSNEMFEKLYAQQATAMAHASRLLSEYSGQNPASENPSTTVHLLVAELNRFAV